MKDEDHLTMKRRAAVRRAALVAAGCSTYRLGIDFDGEPRSILCLCCGVSSFNAHDIVHHYCGTICHEFHSEWTAEEPPVVGLP